MSTAKVAVLHDFIAADGKWRYVSQGSTVLPTEEARALEGNGYVDVLEVDGATEVWPACCDGSEHKHGG